VTRLILTHFSTRYEDVAPLVAEAREIFSPTDAALDFAEWSVPRGDHRNVV
jgi:ribonuclease Z